MRNLVFQRERCFQTRRIQQFNRRFLSPSFVLATGLKVLEPVHLFELVRRHFSRKEGDQELVLIYLQLFHPFDIFQSLGSQGMFQSSTSKKELFHPPSPQCIPFFP